MHTADDVMKEAGDTEKNVAKAKRDEKKCDEWEEDHSSYEDKKKHVLWKLLEPCVKFEAHLTKESKIHETVVDGLNACHLSSHCFIFQFLHP